MATGTTITMTTIIPQIIANAIVASALYALVAVGFGLMFGVRRFFDLTHGAVAVCGAYAGLVAAHASGIGPLLAVPVGIAASAGVAAATDRAVFAPLRARRASTMVLLVSSLGVMTVLESLLALSFTNRFYSLATDLPRTFSVAGAVFTSVQLRTVAAAVVVTAVLILVLRKTAYGRAVRAVSDDADVAAVVGIRTERIVLATVALGGAIAGMAGLAIGYDIGIQPTMGMQLLLKGVIAAIIGGMGSVPGAALGALLLGFTENVGIMAVGAEWKDAIAFLLLTLFLLLRPKGIMRT